MSDPDEQALRELMREAAATSGADGAPDGDAVATSGDAASPPVAAKVPPAGRKRLIQAFWAAAALSVVLHLAQPYGRYLLYPFAFLSTWAHELGHGLTALVCGGEFLELRLFSNLGGYARHTATGFLARPIVAAGGLLGPAIAGGFLIVAGSRSERVARGALGLVAALVLGSLALWVRSVFGVAMTGAVGVALVALALKGNEFLKLLVLQLLGIQLCLGSLADFDYMFTKEFVRDGETVASDTQSIAQSLLLPYWFWGALIAAISLGILLLAFYVAWLRPLAKARAKAKE